MNMNIFDLPRTEEESIIFLQNKAFYQKNVFAPMDIMQSFILATGYFESAQLNHA